MLNFSSDIKYLKGVGEARAKLFRRLGVDNIGSLVRLFPRAYEDWSRVSAILDAVPGEQCCIKAMVCSPVTHALIRKGMTIYKTQATDGENIMKITIFNNRFAAEKLEEGEEYLFFGRIQQNGYSREMLNPQIEKASTGERIRPIYPQTVSLSSRMIEGCVRRALDSIEELPPDILSTDIKNRYALCDYKYALEKIHFPKTQADVMTARRRLSFEELYVLQTGMMLLRGRNRKQAGCQINKDCSEEFFSLLPFSPTGAQKRAVKEAIEDMKKPQPMNRLLQGDVGSGKTAVAAAVAHTCAANSFQCAIMAPTEILAAQHYRTFCKLLESTDLRVELLVGSTPAKEKKRIKERFEIARNLTKYADSASSLKEARNDTFTPPFGGGTWLVDIQADKINVGEIAKYLNNITSASISIIWVTNYTQYKKIIDLDAVKKLGIYCFTMYTGKLYPEDITYVHNMMLPEGKRMPKKLLDYLKKNYTYDEFFKLTIIKNSYFTLELV